MGVLTPSDAVEMPCLADIEEEEEEEDWEDDWDEDWDEDHDDNWGSEEVDKIEKEAAEEGAELEIVEKNFFSALSSKVNLQIPEESPLSNLAIALKSLKSNDEGERNGNSTTKQSSLPDCDLLCLSMLSATFSFLVLLIVIAVFATATVCRKRKDNF